jgi:pyruvate ferredoxin oxidoreductase delta subunit
VALAKRNIRSLLCHSRDSNEVCEALQTALAAAPRDAEDALEDACLEMNLRFAVFASPDAALWMEDRSLVITDGTACTVRIARRNLRSEGSEYFGPEAMARLAALEVDEIRFSPGAISPVWMQLEAGAVMSPDTAHQHLRKGGWRALRKPDFIKEYCVACGRCFIHCPDNAVIHAAYDKHAKATTGILGVDTERCTACGLCAAVCPTNRDGYKAIVMIEADAESSAQLHCVG